MLMYMLIFVAMNNCMQVYAMPPHAHQEQCMLLIMHKWYLLACHHVSALRIGNMVDWT